MWAWSGRLHTPWMLQGDEEGKQGFQLRGGGGMGRAVSHGLRGWSIGAVSGAASVWGWDQLNFAWCGRCGGVRGAALGTWTNWSFLTVSTHPVDGSQTLSCIWDWSCAGVSCLSLAGGSTLIRFKIQDGFLPLFQSRWLFASTSSLDARRLCLYAVSKRVCCPSLQRLRPLLRRGEENKGASKALCPSPNGRPLLLHTCISEVALSNLLPSPQSLCEYPVEACGKKLAVSTISSCF